MKQFLDDIHGRYAAEKKALLALCSNGTGLSVADLSHELGTSIPKVTRVVNEMIQDGYLAELGNPRQAGGPACMA